MARVPKQKVSDTKVAEVQPDVTSVVRKARAPSPVVRSVLQVTPAMLKCDTRFNF